MGQMIKTLFRLLLLPIEVIIIMYVASWAVNSTRNMINSLEEYRVNNKDNNPVVGGQM